jgi:hypothetical protein
LVRFHVVAPPGGIAFNAAYDNRAVVAPTKPERAP